MREAIPVSRIAPIPTAHRPWPVPDRPWAMFMRWHELMFMHWPVPAEALRPLIPPALSIDTFDGEAWLGVVPFRMSGIRAHFLPPIPGTAAFPELNVRTYVTVGGKPGVWFFSLDATNRLAVRGARLTFHLPYFDADIQTHALATRPSWVDYQSMRTHRGAPPAEFDATYGPTGPAYNATPGTLDYFLTERYCLYCADAAGAVYRSDIAHAPWPLQKAEAEVRRLQMTGQIALKLPDVPPLLHYASVLDVVAWIIRRAA